MTEQTGDVLADIDAALEGWHGRDASIGPDAMRWAPGPPACKSPEEEAHAFIADIREQRERILNNWVAQLMREHPRRVRVVEQGSWNVLVRYVEPAHKRWQIWPRWRLVLAAGRVKGDVVEAQICGTWPWPSTNPG